MELLRQVLRLVAESGFRVVNIDATIIAQKPKLAPYIPQMRRNISVLIKADEKQINIKATTTEGLGFTGRGEGIAAMAVVLLEEC